jgi:hypothetical protein
MERVERSEVGCVAFFPHPTKKYWSKGMNKILPNKGHPQLDPQYKEAIALIATAP